MSEEIDYDTNSVYTGVTEDVFEEFQAKSMHYQEEELSLPLNGSTCVDQPSFSDSKYNCPEIEVTSTIEDIQEDECLANVYFNCSNESDDLDIIKNVPDTQNLEICTTEPNTSTFDVLDNFKNTDEINIPQNVYKKRGRKKKNDSSMVADNMSVTVQHNTTQRRGRKKRSEVTQTTLNNETENIVKVKEPLKSRIGNKRLAKSKLNNKSSVGPNSEEISPETIPQLDDLNLSTDPQIVNNDISMKIDDTTQNIFCDTPVAGETKTSGSRRGRPRGRGGRRGKVQRIAASEANSCKNIEITMDISNDQMNKIKGVSSDEEDNECLSKLKGTLGDNVNQIIEPDSEEVSNLQEKETELEETVLTPSKRNIKIPMMDDYEYNVDTVIKETVVKEVDAESPSSLLEDINTRPSRRQVKKIMQYRDESDEDPFANMGSSEEDEPKKGKHHYYSDEEYIPGSKKTRHSYLDSSDEEIDEDLQEVKKLKRKKSKLGKSPTKAKKLATEESNQCTLTSSNTVDDEICEVDDIEKQLQPTFIGNNAKSDETSAIQSWGTSREFENFLAKKIQGSQLKIKKISTASEANNSLTPLEIPVIDPKEMKKFVDVHAQTDKVKTTSFWTQTCAPNAVKMKDNVDLTEKQSENACEFLKNVFQKTSSLGQLMTKKSDAFVEKKIKTSFVKDTFGIDSCVEKTFLLIKLAKNDLQQMEDNLVMEYDKFLETNNLIAYKETEKKIKPRLTQENNDSDCEIIEIPDEPKTKPKFNPKTVFLNKELSIKIAKKPSATNEPKENKINIKGKSGVWINKSIMVKKVKPTQSFLAQDSRNKKPPDSCVTYKMVNDFFKSYYRQHALKICAPFVSTDWFAASKNQIICNYFFVKQENSDLNETSNDLNNVDGEKKVKKCNECTLKLQSLSSLCLAVLRKQMQIMEHQKNASVCRSSLVVDDNLNQLDFKIRKNVSPINENCVTEKKLQETVLHATLQTLSSLCLEVLKNQIQIKDEKLLLPTFTDIKIKKIMNKNLLVKPFSVFLSDLKPNCINIEQSVLPTSQIKRLLSLCLDVVKTQMKNKKSEKHTVLKYIVNNTATHRGKMDKYIQFVNGANHATHDKYSTKDVFRNNNSEVLYTSASQTLLDLCLDVLKKQMQITNYKNKFIGTSFFNEVRNDSNENYPLEKELKKVKQSEDFESLQLSSLCPDTLKHISFIKLRNLLNDNIIFKQIPADERSNTAKNKVKPLSTICFQYISIFINSNVLTTTEATHRNDNVVTLPDYAFVNIADSTNLNVEDNDSQYSDNGSVMNNDEYESYCEDQGENYPMENNWVSQVQMESLMSYDPCSNITENEQEDENIMINQTVLSQVKMEPEDIITSIKEETDFSLEDISILPDSVCTKQEVETQNVSVTLDSFENFVRGSKLMLSLNEEDGVFSQSAARVRRQHAPDSDDENEYDMSLLVPHTFEPLQLNNAKENLMESSSENEQSQLVKKKKIEKRGRGRQKKTDMKNNNKTGPSGDKVEEKSVVNSYVNVITKRMKEKIRQKAQNMESSDSENEIITKRKSDTSTRQLGSEVNEKTSTMLEKNRQEEKISKDKDESNSSKHKTTRIKKVNDAIQYAEVDSTQCILPDKPSKINSTGDIESNVEYKEEDNSDVVDYDEPVELLECEPSLPMLEEEQVTPIGKRTKHKLNQSKKLSVRNEIPYIERHGWHCYPLDPKDEKVYGLTQVVLQKLPEEFVDTYNKYLEISVKNEEDAEVNRLINLQSLKRIYNMGEKKRNVKDKVNAESKSKSAVDTNVKDATCDSDHYAELTPSEDEDEGVEDQIPLDQPLCQTDNHQAKNSLMDDEESDTEGDVAGKDLKSRKSNKSVLIKSKDTKREQEQQELMLTADKMMKTELNLLNTPVDLKKEVDESLQVSPPKEDKKREDIKKKHKSSSKGSNRHNQKKSDDSSSEEEKLWVNTKEKLLKRMGKKQEDTSIEDAKRTKITNEFIVKRTDGDRPNRTNIRGKSRRSYKKFLEHQKQLRVLSHELFGENSLHPGKKYSHSYARGRRNIRKVIDKKSLAKSTVIANMEEFERKRRLITRQNELQEELGVEEDVNVVVINDEVCLEYDFVTHQPVVTIHPFFTKVMKGHQYEGVKFMWDACFESLSTIQSGQPGGGCILAHCMGLGKTLQVLALLHTVMTHPQVGVRRVLVCCPLSTVLNWVDEIHKWIGPVTNKIKVFELSKLKKTYQRAYQLEDWYNGGGIFIIGYELFRSLSTLDPYLDNVRPTIVNKIRTALLEPGPDVVVCDEGHLLKNDCSVLAVAMSRVATRRRIILTGTPIQNNLREYYCMVNFVKPNLLGTYSEYSNRFENPIMNGQHRDSREEDIKLMKARTHILHKVLEGCLQRQEVSVLYPYLPKKHEYTVFISLTKCQWDLYKHYMNNYTGSHNKHRVLKDFHTLQKIWSHPQVLHNFETKARENINKPKVEKIEDDIVAEELAAAEDVKPSATEVWWLPYLDGGDMLNTLEASNKFVAVFKILEECVKLGDKVLIFSTSLFTMDSLEYFLKKIKNWSLGTDYYRLDGSVPPEVRQKWCREFNAESNVETKLFLISTRAGCLGLNMVAANRVVIMDTSWNPAHDVQSIFRVYRFGQKKDCFIYRLVALGTMEQKIYERAVTKQAVACRVVDEQQIDRHYNMSDLMELYRYDETGLGVAGGVAVGVQDVVLLRVARLRALHAVHEHDSLLRGSLERDLPEDERAAAWMQFQQEQAHTHYQNQLAVNLPLLGRPHGHEYAKSPVVIPRPSTTSLQTPIPTVHTSIPENIQEHTPEQPSQPNKFIAFKQCIIPLERLPEIRKEKPPKKIQAKPPNGDLDDSKIKEITNLLIKYNFHTNSPSKLTNLIKRIRYIVTTNQLDILNDCDELTRNIANVMLGKGQANNVDFETVIDSEIKSRTDPVLPRQKSQSNKRKAALSAQQMISHQDPTVISIIDSSDDEWTPNRGVERSKTPVVERSQQDTDEVNRAVASLFGNTDCYSITLSDDEEQPRCANVIKNEVANPTDSAGTQNVENLSLHPSLLTNENFIKIVAHTYLSGNPMLDEDAAVLAAKYSTDKVRAEHERTGNPISSGPIFDIALKVLGKDVMKKIHTGDNVSPKKSTPKEMEPQVPTRAYKPGPKSKKARMAQIAEPMKAVVGPKVKMESSSSNSSGYATEEAAKVVPVSMFKGAGNIAKAFDHLPDPGGECILPDDDFCIVDSNPTPPAIMRKNSQPLIINSVLSIGKNDKGFVQEMNYAPVASKPSTSRRAVPIVRRPLPKGTYVPIAPKPSRVTETGPLQKTAEHTGERTVIQQPELFVMGHDRTLTSIGHVTKSSATLPAIGTTISLDSDDEETIVPTILHPTTTSSHIPTYNTAFPTSVIDSSRLAPNSTQEMLLPHLNNVTGLPAQHILTAVSNNATRGNKFVLVSKSEIDSLKSAPSSKEASTILRRIMNNPTPPSVSATPPLLINVAQEMGVIAPTALPTSTVFSATTSIEAPELVSTPTSAAQTQPTPLKQDIKKTKSTIDKSNVNFKCKPGDILRVTASGALEVLNSPDDQAVAPKKKVAQVTNNDKKKVSASSKVALPKNEETTLKTQTSISDPLDILKDVVHIRADTYETPQVKPKSNEQTNKKVSAAASTKTVTNSQTRTPKDFEMIPKSVFAKAREKLEALKSKINMNTPPTKPTPTRMSKHDLIVSKAGAPVGRIIDTVDLTSFASTSASRNTNRSGSDSKASSVKKSATVVGTSKSIVIGGGGKLVTKTPISKDSPIKQTVNLTKSYSNTTRNVVQTKPLKRPPALVLKTSEVKKKKKADSEMTLNDFDIDDLSDLEDIIELE